MDGIDLVHLQLRLECIGVKPGGILARIPGPDPDDIALVYVYQVENGYQLYLREELPHGMGETLHGHGAEYLFQHADLISSQLCTDGHPARIDRWNTYWFAKEPLGDPHLQAILLQNEHQRLVSEYQPGMDIHRRAVFAIIQDGKVVSTCESVRENHLAGECYTYTLPEYRRRGFASQVTAAWGSALLKAGKVAFYSHRLENRASERVARRLGLQFAFSGISYSFKNPESLKGPTR